jgi:hypothetical protein
LGSFGKNAIFNSGLHDTTTASAGLAIPSPAGSGSAGAMEPSSRSSKGAVMMGVAWTKSKFYFPSRFDFPLGSFWR